jgi:hypothetical protein
MTKDDEVVRKSVENGRPADGGDKVKQSKEDKENIQANGSDVDGRRLNRRQYTISVQTSEPQLLDPTNHFYLPDNNNSGKKTGPKVVSNEGKQKVVRMPTFDNVLTEKIKNGEGFEEIMADPRFKKMASGGK